VVPIVDRSELLSVLQGFNPWWGRRPPSPPAFRRIAYQNCRKFLDDPRQRRAVHLSGPRRVGKTTILLQIVRGVLDEGRDPKSVVYLSLDHPILKLMSLHEVLRLYHESIYPEGSPVLLLLDEVQYARDWELELKQLIDHRPSYRIVATGSASAVQKHKLAESGVGRWVSVKVPTLSFYEFVHIRGDPAPDVDADLRPTDLFKRGRADLLQVGAGCRKLMPLFARYLLVGGFPETAKQDDITTCQRLLREDVVERVLKRDMTALFGIRNVNELEKLFIYLCLHTGGILSVQACASALGSTTVTVSNHLNALDQANLVFRLPPAGVAGKTVLKARYKTYLVDAALRNAVLLRGEEIVKNPAEMGTIVETTILRHLVAYYYRDTPEFVYWRDPKTGQEVDVIVRSPAYVLPVEVKYRQDAGIPEDAGMIAYCAQERVKVGYWITQAERDFDVNPLPGTRAKLLRIPAHVFTYLLGQAERMLWGQ
jgi:predicted AAA+ superfamily ATPase